MKFHQWLILLSLMALGLISCNASDPSIDVTDAWGRESPRSAANAAFYMDIHNEGSESDRLTGAESPECGITQLHETRIDEQGVASMQHLEEIEVPASTTVSLAIGGLHIMCLEKGNGFAAGSLIPIKLTFARSGVIEVEAEVREG